jgi:aldehyde dehydrogenase (NAD+)
MNAGQTCIAPDYLLVNETVEREFTAALERAIREFYGESARTTPDYARVVNHRHHRRLVALLKEQEIAYGGEVDETDCYIEPTLLRNVSPESPVMQEEIFGPILPILSVSDLDEAIRFVNAREKPLALYLFSRNQEHQERILNETTSGGVCLNGTILHISDARMPFGGVGPSGMGAYHGRHTFEAFSHRKAVLKRGFGVDLSLMYPPYPAWLNRLTKRFLG